MATGRHRDWRRWGWWIVMGMDGEVGEVGDRFMMVMRMVKRAKELS